MDETLRKKRRLEPSELVLIALALGAATGVFFGEMAGWLKIVGDVFIQLLLITVIPYIAISLVTGLGGLSYSEVKGLALKGGGVLLLVWTTTLTVIVLMPLAFPMWPTASFFSTSLVDSPQAPDFLRLFIPSNPFYALANAIVPATVVFCILIGIALIGLENKAAVLEPLAVIRAGLMFVTGFIAKLAPIGVFALMASNVGTIALDDLARLQVYIVLYALIALVLSLGVLPGLITAFTPLRYRDLLRALHTPLVTAFATGSALVVLPLLIERCRQLIADTKVFNEEKRNHADASVKVLVPVFYPFPSPALLLALFFVLFSGWYVGSQVPSSTYPLLFLTGVPSLFGGTMLTVPYLLDLAQLPSDLFQLFISVDVVASRFGTLLGAMHFATIGLIGSFALVGGLRFRWFSFIRCVLVSIVLVAVALGGVRMFYTHVVVAPYTKDELLKSLRFMGTPQPATVHRNIPAYLKDVDGKPATLHEIEERGALRVCYQPNEYPSAFYNSEDPPELVGFDIEMAHGFARRLGLPLEFIPARHAREAEELLNAGVCDLYMRSLQITPRKTQRLGLTSAVYQSSLGLIVRDHRRWEFQTWEQVWEHGSALRLGLEDTPEPMVRVRYYLPEANIVPIRDLEEQLEILASGGGAVDAIFDFAEEGAALTLLYPEFSLVVPKPTVSIPVAYAVAHENRDLLRAFDAWLVGEKAGGTVDSLYRHWMLGEAARAERPPRWCIIRDVLGWVE